MSDEGTTSPDPEQLPAPVDRFDALVAEAKEHARKHNPQMLLTPADANAPKTPDDMQVLHNGYATVQAHLRAHKVDTNSRMMRALSRSFQDQAQPLAALSAIGPYRFASLMAEGYSLAEIADTLNVSHMVLARWIQSRADDHELFATAQRLGVDALLAEATKRLRNIDVESRGGAAAASAFADFAKWRAAVVDPSTFGTATARTDPNAPNMGVSVNINMNYDSDLPMRAEVVDAHVLRLNRQVTEAQADEDETTVITIPQSDEP